MIELCRGNLLQADADALVNAVNCVGVMGAGIAAQFKKAFPEYFKRYRVNCQSGIMRIGVVVMQPIEQQASYPRVKYIADFPTKFHWQEASRLESIQQGLSALVTEVAQVEIQSIAVPALGCGLGGLKWDEVKPLIEEAFSTIPEVRVLLYQPQREW